MIIFAIIAQHLWKLASIGSVGYFWVCCHRGAYVDIFSIFCDIWFTFLLYSRIERLEVKRGESPILWVEMNLIIRVVCGSRQLLLSWFWHVNSRYRLFTSFDRIFTHPVDRFQNWLGQSLINNPIKCFNPSIKFINSVKIQLIFSERWIFEFWDYKFHFIRPLL